MSTENNTHNVEERAKEKAEYLAEFPSRKARVIEYTEGWYSDMVYGDSGTGCCIWPLDDQMEFFPELKAIGAKLQSKWDKLEARYIAMTHKQRVLHLDGLLGGGLPIDESNEFDAYMKLFTGIDSGLKARYKYIMAKGKAKAEEDATNIKQMLVGNLSEDAFEKMTPEEKKAECEAQECMEGFELYWYSNMASENPDSRQCIEDQLEGDSRLKVYCAELQAAWEKQEAKFTAMTHDERVDAFSYTLESYYEAQLPLDMAAMKQLMDIDGGLKSEFPTAIRKIFVNQ